MKIKKIIAVVILSAIVVFFLVRAKRTSDKTTLYSEKATVKEKTIKELVSASGKISAEKQAQLKFQTSGQLAKVLIKEGDFVEQGQLIAQLDTRELEMKLKKYLNSYLATRWDFEEDKNDTYKDKVLTDTIKRILEKNQFNLNSSILDVEIADLTLKFSNLTTPISGIVTSVEAPQAGVNVTPTSATFTIVDYNDISFKIDVDEVNIGKVELGQPVTIKLDAYPDEEFWGMVSFIGFTSTITSSGSTAFPVKIKFPANDSLKFKIGMNGDAEIETKKIEHTLVIPTPFLFEEKSKYYVYLLNNHKLVKQDVKIGLETDDEVEIVSGLKKGQTVAIPTE